MKQVLQDLRSGASVVIDAPDPAPARGQFLVRVHAPLLSAGTGGVQVARARQSLFSKIRQKPELLKRGLAELRDRGLAGIQEKLASKYEGYAELGCSCAGSVVQSGEDKGPAALLDAFIHCLIAGQPPQVRVEDAIESSLLTLAARQSLRERRPVDLAEFRQLLE